MISSFATSVEDQDENVKKNIFLAVQKLDGFTIAPGAVFSFNEIVGEGSAQNGFVEGRVLYRDTVRFEPGGGLCQVSTTLFNAFLLAGFRKIERHRHFQPVSYVPLGLDATIKYGKKDLKMKNVLSNPVLLRVALNEKTLLVTLLSANQIPYKYELITNEEILETPQEFLSPEASEKKIRHGISVYVYRKKFQSGKFLESYLLHRDFYPPVYFK
jgi:vancomycin resistance protein YoaR